MRASWWKFLALVALAGAAPTAHAGEPAVLVLAAPQPVELQSGGFELGQPGRIRIDARGLRFRRVPDPSRRGPMVGVEQWFESKHRGEGGGCYAWVLDAASRKTVWVLDLEQAGSGQDEGDFRTEQVDLELPAGRYEVFLYGGHQAMVSEAQRNADDAWTQQELARVRGELARCEVRVTTEKGNAQPFAPTGRFEDALIALTAVGDTEFRRAAFELAEGAELQVHALLEFPSGEHDPVDFGWIAEFGSGRRVWDLSEYRGRAAGGAAKNRVVERTVRLDPGRYVLAYGTDAAHSAAGFDAEPPLDPLAWGVQLRPGRGFDPATFQLIDLPDRGAAAIDFAGAGDDVFLAQAFRLPRPTALAIHAVGEAVDDGWTWVDHGWILDATTREVVWEMHDHNTVLAGGSGKNRMFEGIIRLPAGDYLAYYTTDGSHSAAGWNAGAPFEPAAWGLRVFVDPAAGFRLLAPEEVARAADLLVDLTGVRSGEARRERFVLTAATEIEIHAVGEGADGEMFDRGALLALDPAAMVWEMEYAGTGPAGGAAKNREVRHRLHLPPGAYEAVFETDASHAFGGWNDRPPRDPSSWGMTIRVVR